jgi:ABC-type nitrate/sulfonate/bicarbonate transport system ATPase subunit
MIELKDVRKEYPCANGQEAHMALSAVSLHVAESEFVCVLGPSGCGKSTLLNLVAGFLRPSSGQVLFDARGVTEPGPERGVVFQDPTLFPWLTVRANVEFGLATSRMSKLRRQEAARKVLHLVGLDGFEQAYPHTLSGGMRQRAALARVLVLEPKALLMDEPFSSLDANSRERLQDELLRIWQSYRRTVLFVTHNVEEAAYLADRVLVMGPAPGSIRGEVAVELPRPRDRAATALRAAVGKLRALLNEMPLLPSTGVR